MSDHAWALKNGDMDQVKELVDGKVDRRAEQSRAEQRSGGVLCPASLHRG